MKSGEDHVSREGTGAGRRFGAAGKGRKEGWLEIGDSH